MHADAEVAVVVGVGYAPALELVDLSNDGAGAETVVATNIFHRAVAFGPLRTEVPASGSLIVNGDVRARAPVAELEERMREAADVLAAVGERFELGDRVITGSVVQAPLQPGDEVTADFGLLGRVTLTVA